jgi:hypothetical protein
MFVGKAIACAPLKGKLLASPTNVRLGWKKLARDKPSSLLRTSINYGQKSFITLAPGVNVIKLIST